MWLGIGLRIWLRLGVIHKLGLRNAKGDGGGSFGLRYKTSQGGCLLGALRYVFVNLQTALSLS